MSAHAVFPSCAVWRMARVVLHLAAGAMTVACVYPLVGRRRRLALKRRWSYQLLGMFGVDLRWSGRPAAAALRVANHVSWLDIFALNAVVPAAFVAKDDVRSWPLIGWLSAHAETVFIRRGSRRAAHETAAEVAALLAAGVDVAVFPEGTTSAGDAVLPFHGALLQGAIMAGAAIQPVALAYIGRDGERSTAAAYCGDTSLLQSMWRLVRADGLTVVLDHLPPRAAAGARRELAAQLRADIAAALRLACDPADAACVQEDAASASPSPASAAMAGCASG